MKSIFIILGLLFSWQALTQSTTGLESVVIDPHPPAKSSRQESFDSETTTGSGNAISSEQYTSMRPTTEAVKLNPNYKPIGVGTKIPGYPKSCAQGWIGKGNGGSYGPRGKMLIRKILESPMRDYFLNPSLPGLKEACPNSDTWGNDERLNMWVLFFAHVADDESDCQPLSKVGNHCKLRCGGEMQLEEEYSRRWSRLPTDLRVPGLSIHDHKFGCRADYRDENDPLGWTQNTENTISCSVEIMGAILCGYHTFIKEPRTCSRNESPFADPPESYWEKVNTGLIKERVQLSPLCHSKSAKGI